MKCVCIAFFCFATLLGVFAEFTCDENDLKIVHYFGNNLTCPDKFVCNTKQASVAKAGSPTPAPLCVPATTICEYDCEDSTTVKVNEQFFTCPQGQFCNKEHLSCQVCVPKTCDKDAFTCGKDTSKVNVGGSLMYCPTGHTCNKDYLQPCSPCIGPSSGKSVTNILTRSFHV